MQITTSRLLLRPFFASDWPCLHEYLSDPEVVRFEPYEPFQEEESRREAENRSKNPGFLAVCVKNDGTLIGNVCQFPTRSGNVEIGYVFHRKFWGQGYACEAVAALVDALFQQPEVHRVFAECNPQNTASEKLLRRLGLRREAWLKQNESFATNTVTGEPIWQDTVIYAILREEWIAKQRP